MALSRLPKVLSTSGQKPTSKQKAVTNCPALFALLTPHPLVQCGSLGELCTGFVLPFCTAVVWKCHQCEIGCKQGVSHYNTAQVCKGVTDCSQNNPTAVIQRENLSNVSAKLEKVTFLLRFHVKKQAKFISHITLVWKGIRRAWLKTYLENHINRITEIYRSLRSLSPPNISSWVTEATQHHCTQGHSTPIGTRYEINCILTSHFHLFCHRFPISTSPCSHHSIPTRTVGSHKGWGTAKASGSTNKSYMPEAHSHRWRAVHRLQRHSEYAESAQRVFLQPFAFSSDQSQSLSAKRELQTALLKHSEQGMFSAL